MIIDFRQATIDDAGLLVDISQKSDNQYSIIS